MNGHRKLWMGLAAVLRGAFESRKPNAYEIGAKMRPHPQLSLSVNGFCNDDDDLCSIAPTVPALPPNYRGDGMKGRADARLDARLGRRPSDNVTIALVGRDLLHKDHQEYTDGTRIRRSVVVDLQWRF